MPNAAIPEQQGRPPPVEKPAPKENPRPLKPQEIRRIAVAPTQEQLHKLAVARAREYGNTEPGFMDDHWAVRQAERLAEAADTHADLRMQVVEARNRARWGSKEHYDRWQLLKAQLAENEGELRFLEEPFRDAGLTLDESQIPPKGPSLAQRVSGRIQATGEALARPVKAAGAGIENAIDATRSRVSAARAEIVESVGQKIGAIDGARKQLGDRLDLLRTELTGAVGDAVSQKKKEISALVASARIAAERSSDQAILSVKLVLVKARARARETLGPFSEMIKRDKELIRTKAAAASEQVARSFETNKAMVGELLAAISQQAAEKAGVAFGLPRKGMERLREVGGVVVDEFNLRVNEPIAQEYRRRKEALALRVQSAKERLNRMFEVYGDRAGPVFAAGKEAATRVGNAASRVDKFRDSVLNAGERGAKVASEFIRSSKERVGRAYEAVSDMVVARASDLWSRTEGLSKADIAMRTGLLKARLANVSNVVRQAGLRAEEAAVFRIALGSIGAERVVGALPKSARGRMLLAGGLVVGGLAALAVIHPDVFGSISDALGSIGSGDVQGGVDAASSASQGGGDVAIQVGPNISGAEILPAAPGGGVDVLPAYAANFGDFLNHATTVQPGDTLWEIVKGQTVPFGDWVSPSGVNKGDVVADIVRQFMQTAGENPDLIHPGEVFSLANLNLPPDQLAVIENALKSTSFEQYQADVMPQFVGALR